MDMFEEVLCPRGLRGKTGICLRKSPVLGD